MDQKIVLLHGMGRTRASMRGAAVKLEALGWTTRRVGYPSLNRSIERLAEHVAAQLEKETDRLHFVTHSLGGLVLRRLIHVHRPANLGRVVMLAPPNRGSRLARRVAPIGRVVPAVRQLAASEPELQRLLGPVDFEVLVIAGSRPLGPLRWLGPESNDGLVTVDETLVDSPDSTVVVPRGHTFIMQAPEVIEKIDRFLRGDGPVIE